MFKRLGSSGRWGCVEGEGGGVTGIKTLMGLPTLFKNAAVYRSTNEDNRLKAEYA